MTAHGRTRVWLFPHSYVAVLLAERSAKAGCFVTPFRRGRTALQPWQLQLRELELSFSPWQQS